MVPPVEVVGIAVWGRGWWLILAHNICLFSQHVPHPRNTSTVLSLVLSELTIEAWLVRLWCLNHC